MLRYEETLDDITEIDERVSSRGQEAMAGKSDVTTNKMGNYFMLLRRTCKLSGALYRVRSKRLSDVCRTLFHSVICLLSGSVVTFMK